MKFREVNEHVFPAWMDDRAVGFHFHRTNSLRYVCKYWDKRRACVQAGGSYGVWARICASKFDTVYTFEPAADAFACLARNLEDRENVIKMQAALGDTNKCVCLQKKSDSNHRIVGDGYIPTLLIDDLHMRQCDAIFLDVEGYEYYALRGAARTIEENKPLILVEDRGDCFTYHQLPEDCVTNLLTGMNYRLVCEIDKDKIWVHKKYDWNPPTGKDAAKAAGEGK